MEEEKGSQQADSEQRSEYSPAHLLRIDGLAGMYYKSPRETPNLVIYGIGAPIPPDNGTLPDAPYILNRGVDIFVPDYIGYGRSDGEFTPENCIKTFTDLYKAFKDGCQGKSSYEFLNLKLKYNRIIFIGRSLGGTYIPLLPRFNSQINELAIFCPVVDSKSCGSIEGEETNQQFLDSMRYDGYHYLYRGILKPRWVDHLENRDDLSPMDNLDYLQNSRLFIGHGLKDQVVHYSKSVNYYNRLLEKFTNNKDQFMLKLYPDGGHDKITTNQATIDFLNWLGL